jgi:transposase-like protein
MYKNATLYDLFGDEILPRISAPVTQLPPPDTKRWVPRRKAAVVNAVRRGAISLEEACRRYGLSVEEYLAWQRAIESHGIAGLRVTRLQTYRDSPPAWLAKPRY